MRKREMGRGHRVDLFTNRPFVAALLTGVGYYLAGLFAVNFTIMAQGIAIMWPPNAMLLAAFLLAPRKYWWMFAVAGAVAEFAADIGSFPVWQIVGFAVVNICETLFAAYVIGRITGTHPMELTLKNLSIMVGVILVVATPLAALGGAKIYALGDPSIHYWQFWRLWWFGDATGLIVTLPVVLSVAGKSPIQSLRLRMSTVEAVGLGGAFLVVWALLFTPLHQSMPWAASPVLLMLSVVWIAMRTTPIITTSAALCLSLSATLATTAGVGPFTTGINEAANVLAIQEFLVATSILALFLSYAISEVKRMNRELEARNVDLEAVVAERTSELTALNADLRTNLQQLEEQLRAAEHKRRALIQEMSEKALQRADMVQLNSQLLHKLKSNSEEMDVLRNQIQYFTEMLSQGARDHGG